jgi:putative ABC transport system substrate-binding protein
MRRRDFITLLGSVAVGYPITAQAQRIPVVGFLNSGSPATSSDTLSAFLQGLKTAGFTEGQNVTIEYRWADGQYDRLPELAADLVRRKVDVIAANGPAAVPAKSATATIPIVFRVGGDPIQLGLVASLNRPGRNLTGVSALSAELGPKRLELLQQLLPDAGAAAVLVNPTNAVNAEPTTSALQAAAATLGLRLHVLQASTEHDLETAFAALAQTRAGGLVIGNDAFFTSRSQQLAMLALRHGVPTIYQFREFAAAGGLMSYGDSVTDQYRLFGLYTARILKGEKPAEVPVQQATKVDLIINLKTAKALHLDVPTTLLARADEVIE